MQNLPDEVVPQLDAEWPQAGVRGHPFLSTVGTETIQRGSICRSGRWAMMSACARRPS